MPNLNEYIEFNSEFRSSVNLYLSLNKEDKINSFIPTKSSVDILGKYLEAVEENRMQATLLLGPYGKGKTHLLLMLLAVLTLERNSKNSETVSNLIKKVKKVDSDVAERIEHIWNKRSFLPVLISGAQDDLAIPFLVGISDALKRAQLKDLIPDTYYSHALECISRWKKEYPDTYEKLINALNERNVSITNFVKELKRFSTETLELFRALYSEITAGGVFNPLVSGDVLPIYRNVSEQLVENYNYSGIYIIFDEFSKFIEGQDKKAAGNNMKLLQDICELAADSKHAQLFITMVAHKGVKEYGNYLSKDIINSFTGIEGRIEEIQFVTSTKNNYELIQNAIFKKDSLFADKNVLRVLSDDFASRCFDVPAFKSTFNREDFNEIVLKGCYPLSPVSAYLLLNVSEKVAQNERTLFTFISKEEQGSMASFVKGHRDGDEWIVSADRVYDYFKSLFKKSIANPYVHNEWLNAEYALSQGLSVSEQKIVKALALITIVNKPAELPANIMNIVLAAGIANAESVVGDLEERGVIYKKSTDNTYVFKTRATSDARNEIQKRKALRAASINIASVFEEVDEVKYILPRKYNHTYSMTRFFNVEYMDVEAFLQINDGKAFFDDYFSVDGKVIYVFSTSDKTDKEIIKKHVRLLNQNKLIVVVGTKSCDVIDSIKEYDAISDLKRDTKFFAKEDNKVLLSELPILEDEARSSILTYLASSFSDSAHPEIIRLDNGRLSSDCSNKLVDVVDSVASDVFFKSIIVNNELINKKTITTAPIKKARINIIEALIYHKDEVIASYLRGTSADSTIYRALFKNNDIDVKGSNESEVIQVINDFITACGNDRKKVSELTKALIKEPYGVRLGVIPVYLAYCICNREEDIIVYFSDKEVQIDAACIVNMCENPEDFSIYISLEDVAKEKYIKSLYALFKLDEEKKSDESRIQVVYLSMQKWFKGLPQVTKNIKKQPEYFSQNELERAFPQIKSILQAVDGNPYEAVFVLIPKAFNTDDLEKTFKLFKLLHDKLDTFYEYVQSKIIDITLSVIAEKAENDLRHSLRNWYEAQSDGAKNGLFSNSVNELMKLASTEKYIDDATITERLSKIIIGVYFDSWNDSSLSEYEKKLRELVKEIESIGSTSAGRKETLIFTAKDGSIIEQQYDLVDEGTGTILKNIISDALEDFSDLPVNDKVAILLEMIEKTIG